MRKLLQHIRIEALLFLVFAALIWFVMTVSATTIERQYTMSFTADMRQRRRASVGEEGGMEGGRVGP